MLDAAAQIPLFKADFRLVTGVLREKNYLDIPIKYRLPWWLRLFKNLPAMQKTQFHPWVGKIPWRREQLPTSVCLPGKSHGQRSLVGYCPQGCKKSDTTE